MNYPQFVKIGDKKYSINTDFRVAIECQKIATDRNINDYERTLAIIFKLFGDDGLNSFDNYARLLELAIKYLSCGKDEKNDENVEPDMDFEQDIDYIEASFMSDYNIDLTNIEMHWWKFNNLINGLSNSEIGNCCVLNRIRNIRTYDTSKIKDIKERSKIEKIKRTFALRETPEKITEEQQKNVDTFYQLTGLKGKE